MIDQRRIRLERHLANLRAADGWHPFQNFVLGLLQHLGYSDVRLSHPRSDYGRDAVAITPDGQRCFVAASFECSKAKVLADASRWREDSTREAASVMVFMTSEAPIETQWSPWKTTVASEFGLELRLFHLKTILDVATRDSIWRETCARLGLPGDRPGYRIIAPYDSEVVRASLRARPPEWLSQTVALREWAALAEGSGNRLILGKPGAGKTTSVFWELERLRPAKTLVVESDLRHGGAQHLLDQASGGAVIVFDDAHEKPEHLRELFSALRARLADEPEVRRRFQQVHLLIAARSQDWGEVSRTLPLTELQDLGLLEESQIVLRALSSSQCRELIDICCEEWGLVADPELRQQAATLASEADGTPFYVLSMFSPVRSREDKTLHVADLAGLPRDVLGLWRRYWARLSPPQQGLLRLVKFFAVTLAPTEPGVFAAAGESFGIPPHELSAARQDLEAALWLSPTAGLPNCLDVQLEAIVLGAGDYALWDRFIGGLTDPALVLQFRLGAGEYYGSIRAAAANTRSTREAALVGAESHLLQALDLAVTDSLRALVLNNQSNVESSLADLEPIGEARRSRLLRSAGAIELAVTLYRKLGAFAELAGSLNNAAAVYNALAELELTVAGRRAGLVRATAAIEEAVRLYQAVGSPGDLAMSLNNAANRYSSLAGLESTVEGRRARLAKAVATSEEAVTLHRAHGAPGDLAGSLNNAGLLYHTLAELESTVEGRRAGHAKAAAASEEAVTLYRALSVPGGLAGSLNNVATSYNALAGLESTEEVRRAWLAKATAAIEEAISLRRAVGVPGDLASSLNGAATYYDALADLEPTMEGRRAHLAKATAASEEAVELHRALGVPGDLAGSLRNAAALYETIAGLESTGEGRRTWLAKATEAGEEAVTLHRSLGVPGDLAASLNNASALYETLAGLESTVEGRRAWLGKASAASEEAVTLYRALGASGNLAGSLANAAIFYNALAEFESTAEGRWAGLAKAIAASEEAVTLYRALGGSGDLAGSLTNAAAFYEALAGLEPTTEARRARLVKAAAMSEEAVTLCRALGAPGALAMALNNAANRYNALAGLEPTVELRRAGHAKATAASEEAVRLYRALDSHGPLATSLNNAANGYFAMALLESTEERRRVWLARAAAAIEEGIKLRRVLGVPCDTARALNNAVKFYNALAGLESTVDGRRAGLLKAAAAGEEEVTLYRALGGLGDLAISLATLSRLRRNVAQISDETGSKLEQLEAAFETISEASRLLREAGDRPNYLVSLYDRCITIRLLVGQGEPVDRALLRQTLTEGRQLAEALGNGDLLTFFGEQLDA